MENVLFAVLGAGGAIAIVVLALRSSTFGKQATELGSKLETLTKELDETRKSDRERKEKLDKKTAEIEELREKLKSARKRASGAQDEAQKIRSQIDDDSEHEARKQALEAARGELDKAYRDLDALRLRLTEAEQQARRAAERATNQPAESRGEGRSEGRSETAVVRDDSRLVDELRAQLDEWKSRSRRSDQEKRTAIKRADRTNHLYLVTKGRLEIVEDRFRVAKRSLAEAGIQLPPSARQVIELSEEEANEAANPESFVGEEPEEIAEGANAAEGGEGAENASEEHKSAHS